MSEYPPNFSREQINAVKNHYLINSQVPLTSVAINSGNSDAADSGGSPLGKEKEPPPLDPPI